MDIPLQHFDKILTPDSLRAMYRIASEYRDRDRIYGGTKVGAAVLASTGELYGGCNIEHRWRCHDIHAEVSAISAMVGGGCSRLRAIVLVANRPGLAPCGGCLDWIFQFGGLTCLVGWQGSNQADITLYNACELMPHYPEDLFSAAMGNTLWDENT